MRANFVMSGVWQGIRRNATMTIALVLSTSIALAFLGAAILANIEITHFKKNYEGKLNVSVFLCTKDSGPPCQVHVQHNAEGAVIRDSRGRPVRSAATDDLQTLTLQKQLNSDGKVTSVNYVSADENYNRAKATTPSRVAKLISPDSLPASFTVKLQDQRSDFKAFSRAYSAASGVYGVTNKQDVINKLLDIIDGARLFSIAIALVVLIASILLISNTIQVAAAQRKNETSIMRLVGASRWMTELPFMLETVIATVIGGLIAFGLVSFGKHFVLNNIFGAQVTQNVIPNLDGNDLLVASGIGMISGIVLAAVTAFITLRFYVKL